MSMNHNDLDQKKSGRSKKFSLSSTQVGVAGKNSNQLHADLRLLARLRAVT